MEFAARINPEKVAAYIRWSTDEQTQGTTLEVQRAACESYIRSQGWSFNEKLVFVDDGYSGATLVRPALRALREAISEGLVECVVVYTLDRLSRSVVDTVDLVLREWENRCHVRCVQQPIDTTHPTGKMFFYMLASYAEFERDMIRMRTLGGKLRRAKEGANAGWRYNYGYRKAETGVYGVDPERAEIVRWLFREYVAGKGFKQLAVELNAKRIPSPGNKQRWSPNTVRTILANPIYMGRIEYGKERRVLRDGKILYARSKTPRHSAVDGAVQSLVDKELWEQAQRRRQERAGVSRRALNSAYLLSGLARCGRCNRPLSGVLAKGTRFYQCVGRKEYGDGFCDAGVLRADVLEPMVVAKLKEELQGEALEQALKAVVRQHEEEVKAATAELAVLEAERNAVSNARRRLDAAFDRGELEPKVYNRRDQELEEKLLYLSVQMEKMKGKLRQLQAASPKADALKETASRIDAWEHLEIEEQKALLRDAIDILRVYRAGWGRRRELGSDGKFTKNTNPVEIQLVLRL